MNQQRTLVFVGGHPDDETFGIGGTLAQYAASGVKVYYVCATRGEAGTIPPELMRQGATAGDIRWSELECAARALGLAGITHLGYRDSGMPGSPDNRHPEALAAAPAEQVVGRLVKIFRDFKPEVVVTFDPIGGYRHPDHIAVHTAAVAAFHAAGDQKQYPEAGPPFAPQKLYFNIFPRGLLKIVVKVLPIFGQDPRHFGQNKDIDIASLVEVDFPTHAVIRLAKQSIKKRDEATACYVSQVGGGPPRINIFAQVFKLYSGRDLFMRAYPPPGKARERDLFEGVT